MKSWVLICYRNADDRHYIDPWFNKISRLYPNLTTVKDDSLSNSKFMALGLEEWLSNDYTNVSNLEKVDQYTFKGVIDWLNKEVFKCIHQQ